MRKAWIHRTGLLLLGALYLMVPLPPASAGGGLLDTSFGHGGKVTTSFSAHHDEISAIAVQPDGKFLAGGSSQGHLALVRYQPDGSLDSEFGASGIVTTSYGRFAGLALEADGSIVAGTRGYGQQPSVLVRFASDGSPDATFGIDGSVIPPIELCCGDHAVAIQGDGKIMVAGQVFSGGECCWDFALARLNGNGSVDSTFGSDGVADLGAGDCAAWARAVAVRADGRILASGADADCGGGGSSSRLVRVTASGTLDRTFEVSVRAAAGEDAFEVSPDQGGSVLMAAETEGGFLLARYTSKGILDQSFGEGGIVLTPSLCGHALSAFTVQANGDILAAGSYHPPGGKLEFELTRLLPKGTLDPTFGTGGRIATPFFMGGATASSITLQADGKILVGGEAAGSAGTDFAVARYLDEKASTGALTPGSRDPLGPNVLNPVCQAPKPPLDLAFGRAGVVSLKHVSSPVAVALQPDGKIAVADAFFDVVRLRPNGRLDPTFGGGDGLAHITFAPGKRAQSFDLALEPDGRIVVFGAVGGSKPKYSRFVLARLTAAGHPDRTFSGDGRVVSLFPAGASWVGGAMAIQRDGSIVTVGRGGGQHETLARYKPDGSPDRSFGNGGHESTGIETAQDYSGADVAIESTGKIVVAGPSTIARYNKDGTLDTAFGQDGYLTPDLGGQLGKGSVAIDSTDRILIVGAVHGISAVGRYLPNGRPDKAFGVQGWTVVCTRQICLRPEALAVEPNRDIVVAGLVWVTEDITYFTVARLKPRGHLDQDFGWHGWAVSSFSREASAVSVQPDGKIVAVGSWPPVVVRYRSP
jgi:uncharacterized delta-60 repeat protein